MSKRQSLERREQAQARRERAAQLRREQQARERRRRLLTGLLVGLLVVAAVAALVVGIIVNRPEDRPDRADLPDPAGTQTFQVASATHVEGPVAYPQTPPVGGNHSAVWQNCGIYGDPVANENAVHSMEHGAVWVTYRPDLPDDQVEALRDELDRTYLLLSPYPDLPAPIVASAWGVQLQLQTADDPRLDQFIEKYRQGPQTPEPGAVCTGGIGQPIQ